MIHFIDIHSLNLLEAALVDFGLDYLENNPHISQMWGRCGLLCNQASVNSRLKHTIDVLSEQLGNRLLALFSPQHGLESTVQDNMIETNHSFHQRLNIPIYSLYSETRKPTTDMLKGIDTLIVDLQLVGCRVYTFKWTIKACLEKCKEMGIRVVVLDRPNPLGGQYIEGRLLEMDMASFVGGDEIPMRHGLTTAEFSRFVNRKIGCDLEVVELVDWDPKSMWNDLKRPWLLTSPNLPTFESVCYYPGLVLLEGTNLSEGRGTGLPFQLLGSSYISDASQLVSQLFSLDIAIGGTYIRPCSFQPTSSKWSGKECRGVHFVCLEPEKVNSFNFTIRALQYIFKKSQDFNWAKPPYEYNYSDLPIEVILGARGSKEEIETGEFRLEYWNFGIENYIGKIKQFLLYDREMLELR